MSLSRHSRAMLLNVLWHHQGGSSPVGHPIRKILGIEPHARLTNEELSEAKWIDELLSGSVALAEQNEKQRAFLEFAWKDIPMNEYAFKILEHVMNLPNLATPVLNRIKAEGMRDAAMHCSKHGSRTADEVSEDLFAKADELEQSK